MLKGYHHLTYEARCQIHALKQRGDTLAQIARQLQVSRATVSREIRRNSGGRGYRYKQADTNAKQRRIAACSHPRKMCNTTISLIREKLAIQWSPEQISGWLAVHYPPLKISHETIYKYVWADKLKGGRLFVHLRHRGKKHNKRSSSKAGRGCIPNRVGIEERPEIVNAKIRTGDWEIDTVIGRQREKGVVVSMVDRASKLTKLAKVSSRQADEVSQALIVRLGECQDQVRTITADNGKEFAYHELVSTALDAKFFFATPYHSWERGLNEHTNGLIRQYLPKGSSLTDVTQENLNEIEFLLNNRPRKVLNYATPIEVFQRLKMTIDHVALRT
jgi:transposase, IS30 family